MGFDVGPRPGRGRTEARVPRMGTTRRHVANRRRRTQDAHRQDVPRTRQLNTASDEPAARDTNSTTSFLTATTLIYAIGAGITAAAGTRLALQLILVKGFKVYSFRLRGLG